MASIPGLGSNPRPVRIFVHPGALGMTLDINHNTLVQRTVGFYSNEITHKVGETQG